MLFEEEPPASVDAAGVVGAVVVAGGTGTPSEYIGSAIEAPAVGGGADGEFDSACGAMKAAATAAR